MIRKGKIVNIILNFTLTRRPSVEKNFLLRAFMRKMSVFRSRWLSKTSVFFTSFSGCESYAFGLSELCFEALTCGKWAAQMPQMTRSKATNDNLRSHKWQISWQKVKVEWGESNFSLHNLFLDCMKKLTKICRIFSKIMNKRRFFERW